MELAREIMKAREEGKSIGLAELLEEVINAFMDDGKPYSSFQGESLQVTSDCKHEI